MVTLKEINYEYIEKEYKAIISIPKYEDGFENPYFSITKEKFINEVIPLLIDQSNGKRLNPGYVPDTYYFLWDDSEIVGLFKIRHYLNEALKNGAGHIGYTILKQYRCKGYATIGLQLAKEICKGLIKEDEIYLSCHKDNPASLRVQMKCGAYLTHEDDKEFYTRIKLKK